MLSHFSIRDSSIKILIHLTHKLEDLFLGDVESHSFKHIVELVNLDVIIFVIVDLIKNLLQSQTALFQNFYQVVKNLILSLKILPFCLKLFDLVSIVSAEEIFQLSELDYSIVIWVNFLEQRTDLKCLQTQIEVFTKTDLEISQG